MKEAKESEGMTPQNVDIPEFKGYTLDELCYHRAMLTLQREFCKERILLEYHNLTHGSKSEGKSKSGKSIFSTAGIFSRVFKSLDYIDYVLMGISAFTSIRKITGFFRKKK